MNCALMFILSNNYGTKYHCILLQLEQCSDLFKVISDRIAHWYEMINTITLKFISAMQSK